MAVTLVLSQGDLGGRQIALAKGDSDLSSLLSTRGPCLPTLIKDLNGVITRTELCIRGWSKSRAIMEGTGEEKKMAST